MDQETVRRIHDRTGRVGQKPAHWVMKISGGVTVIGVLTAFSGRIMPATK